MYHNFSHSTAMTAAEHKWDLKLTRDTPYLALMGELWGVCCEEISENCLRCNSTTLYFVLQYEMVDFTLTNSHLWTLSTSVDGEAVSQVTNFTRYIEGSGMKRIDFYTPVFRRDVLWYGAVRPSVRPSVRPTVSTKKHRCKWRIFFKFCTQVCLGVPSINLLFVLSYLIKYAHNSIISDFSIFGIHRVIF